MNPARLPDTLRLLLLGGLQQIGQVWITTNTSGWELRHVADAAASGITIYRNPEDAREIVRFTEVGTFRPLKTSPDLRRGWCLQLQTLDELHRSLDYLYPAMLGNWRSFAEGRLPVVTLRETVSRQTGMYRVTGKITNEQADQLIGGFCQSCTGCLKTILWEITPGRPVTTLPPEKFQPRPGESLPLLCEEPCHFLIAAARDLVKRKT